ncbi:MAG: hypothetical protein K1Y36_29765 [Blastocatellia bacterium]|nr:hypothetical protein [Blastocatellia bacterium]
MTKLKPTGTWDDHVAKDRPKLGKRPEFPWQVRSPEPNDVVQPPSGEQFSGDEKNESTCSQLQPTVASQTATVQLPVASMPATDSTRSQLHDSNPRTVKRPNQNSSYESRNLGKITIRLNQQLINKINDFCYHNNIEKQFFFETVASYTVENVASQPATLLTRTVASQPAHDDMMIFSTHDDIIMRYQTYTNRAWTRRDDREGKRFNQVDIRLIEIAIISTIEKKLRGNTAKQPIKSFNYFTQEIELLLEQQRNGDLPAALNEYHKYVISTWNKRIKPLRDNKWGISEAPAK